MRAPVVNIDLLIIRNEKILLGLLSKEWMFENKQVFGLPGREILFKESIGDAVHRNIKEELGCKVLSYEVFSINANYAFGNHFIGIGVKVSIEGVISTSNNRDWESWDWFELNSIPENLFPPAKNAIESYLQHKVTVSE